MLEVSEHCQQQSQPRDVPTTKDDPTLVLRNENEELKQSLLRLQENYQELQHEHNFYRVKVSELSEIIETRDVPEALVQKSLQNAELTIQVDRLKQELQMATMAVQKMGEQREQNKKLLLELSDIVRTLQSVPVEYKHTSNDPLQNVKTKVETIMEDRRILVLRCQELEHENKQQQNRLEAFEAQFHLLNTINMAKIDIQDHSVPLPSPSSPPPPVDFITRTPSVVSTGTKTSAITTHLDLDLQMIQQSQTNDDSVLQLPSKKVMQDQNVFRTPIKQKPLPVNDSDVVSCSTASCTSHPSDPQRFSSPRTPCWKPYKSESGSMHTTTSSPEFMSDNSDEIYRLQRELAETKQQHQHFKNVCQTAFQKMKCVEQEFTVMRQQRDDAATKRDELKAHLKDVIEQYKTLNQEYEQAMEELQNAKSHIQDLEKSVEELRKEKDALEEYGAEILEEDGVADDVEKLVAAYLVARNTIQSLKEQLANTQRDLEEVEKRRAGGDRNYRDAVAQNRKLQHERKILETRIADAEEQIQMTKKEVLKYKEEAKQTRRRLTSYMRKEGIPSPSQTTSKAIDDGLLLPRLAPFFEKTYV